MKDNSTNYSILNNKDEITNYELSKSSIPLENKKPKNKNSLMAKWWLWLRSRLVEYRSNIFKMVLLNICKKIVKWKKYFQILDDV